MPKDTPFRQNFRKNSKKVLQKEIVVIPVLATRPPALDGVPGSCRCHPVWKANFRVRPACRTISHFYFDSNFGSSKFFKIVLLSLQALLVPFFMFYSLSYHRNLIVEKFPKNALLRARSRRLGAIAARGCWLAHQHNAQHPRREREHVEEY